MAKQFRRRWAAQIEGMSRRDRQGCSHDAQLPDPLVGWDLAIPADVAADTADAEAAVQRLNHAGTTHVSLEGLARFLPRAESALARGGDAGDQVAVEGLGNIAAMRSVSTWPPGPSPSPSTTCWPSTTG